MPCAKGELGNIIMSL